MKTSPKSCPYLLSPILLFPHFVLYHSNQAFIPIISPKWLLPRSRVTTTLLTPVANPHSIFLELSTPHLITHSFLIHFPHLASRSPHSYILLVFFLPQPFSLAVSFSCPSPLKVGVLQTSALSLLLYPYSLPWKCLSLAQTSPKLQTNIFTLLCISF